MEKYTELEELCKLGGNAIEGTFDRIRFNSDLSFLGSQLPAYGFLLGLKNGFYGFTDALHVYPYSPSDRYNEQEVVTWNKVSLWKRAYGLAEVKPFAFAEDIFGYQFCFDVEGVTRFDPETGELEPMCTTLDGWARLMLTDPEAHLGYETAKEWFQTKGSIRRGERLLPIYPFITSEGSADLTNLYSVDALKGMLSRADFARQIKSLSDGQKIEIVPLIPQNNNAN
jgi:hypothetical protein